MSKKESGMVENYNRMDAEYLYQIYDRCSAEKMRIYERCRDLAREMRGYDIRVKKCGTFFFTFAFRFEEEGKEYLYYMTGRNNYKICLD